MSAQTYVWPQTVAKAIHGYWLGGDCPICSAHNDDHVIDVGELPNGPEDQEGPTVLVCLHRKQGFLYWPHNESFVVLFKWEAITDLLEGGRE